MRFGAIIVAGLAAVATAIPAAQVVVNINIITTKSRDLQTPAKALTVVDAALFPIGQGNIPKIIAGFQDIITTVQEALGSMNPETYAGKDADIIFDAFRTFVMVHQQLLNILIGKAGIVQRVPIIGQPMAAILRALEEIVDTFAYSLIDMMQDRVEDMQQQATDLGETIDNCIAAYSPF
ncbi:hypothetical protein K4F52_002474 [Lecanicillium sp. MT-2017a]|nr:hypothetical protein K4F52_002474 [Lecanicillium sp. MT-2017a]